MRNWRAQSWSTRVVSWTISIWEVWYESDLQLENELLRFYKDQLKFWENDYALAFYFFEHLNLSAK